MGSANDSNMHELKPAKKNWREISKGRAAVFTLIIVLVYTGIHWWFINDGYFVKLVYISTIGFFLGFIFGFFEFIEPGTTDTLVYSGKKLSKEWEDGYCLIPSALPFMHRLNFRPLWSLLKKHWSEKLKDEKDVVMFRHDLKIDSANQQKINIDSTLMEATIFQTGKKFFGWFLSMNRNTDFAFQEFGLKIIIIVAVLDCFNLTTASIANFFKPKTKNVSAQTSEETVRQPAPSSSLLVEKPKQKDDSKMYFLPNGDLLLKDGDREVIMPRTFGRHENNSNQQQKCKWTETDWNLDLVDLYYLDFSDRGGCIDFHPPSGKEVGLLFSNKPTKTSGDFTVSSRYNNESCNFSSNDDCRDFIGSHLNEVLIFKGNFYIHTGKM